MQEKICSDCLFTKPLHEFHRKRDGRGQCHSRCRVCRNVRYHRETPEQRRSDKLRQKYGLTISDYALLSEQQGHVCAICKRPETKVHNRSGEVRFLCVDHDHETGRIRGLLCNRCNVGLGQFEDNITSLKNAKAYLEYHKQ